MLKRFKYNARGDITEIILKLRSRTDRVPGDKIDDEVYDYDDSTDFKMWQGSLPHKKLRDFRNISS